MREITLAADFDTKCWLQMLAGWWGGVWPADEQRGRDGGSSGAVVGVGFCRRQVNCWRL